MFRFAHLGRVWWPVQLPYADEEGGEPVTVHMLFQLLTDAELDARERGALAQAAERMKRTQDAADEDAARTSAIATGAPQVERKSFDVDEFLSVLDAAQSAKSEDRESLLARVLDWRDIHDEDDSPIAFAADKLAALLAHRPFFIAVRDALLEASREGTAKNSSRGPDGSTAARHG